MIFSKYLLTPLALSTYVCGSSLVEYFKQNSASKIRDTLFEALCSVHRREEGKLATVPDYHPPFSTETESSIDDTSTSTYSPSLKLELQLDIIPTEILTHICCFLKYDDIINLS